MKRIYSVVALLLALVSVGPVWALEDVESLTLQSAAGATGNGTAMNTARYASIAVQVTISATATVTFEGTQDGSTWASTVCTSTASTSGSLVTSASSTGLYQCNVAGLAKFRARISSFGSGTVTVTARVSTAVFGKKGGSGGGAATSFDQLTAGTNTDALVVGTGGSLATSGSGTIAATTAAALAANGANCSAGQYPLGVDASGAVEGCTAVGSASIIHTFQALTSSGSISGTHKFVTCDATGGAVAITLPAASAVSGADFQIKKIDSSVNACTVTRAGSDTIDGATTAVLRSRYETIGVASDGTSAWSIF